MESFWLSSLEHGSLGVGSIRWLQGQPPPVRPCLSLQGLSLPTQPLISLGSPQQLWWFINISLMGGSTWGLGSCSSRAPSGAVSPGTTSPRRTSDQWLLTGTHTQNKHVWGELSPEKAENQTHPTHTQGPIFSWQSVSGRAVPSPRDTQHMWEVTQFCVTLDTNQSCITGSPFPRPAVGRASSQHRVGCTQYDMGVNLPVLTHNFHQWHSRDLPRLPPPCPDRKATEKSSY